MTLLPNNLIRGAARRVLRQELVEKRQLEDNFEYVSERLASLELALEDLDWARLSFEGEREFSREGLRQIAQLSRLMYLKNPLIQRGVNVKRFYVWGQGISIQVPDEKVNQALQDFIDDPKNLVELTGHQARMQKEVDLEVDGNIFFVFFPHLATGRVRVRTIPFDEIDEVICNPEDAKEPWYYRRRWTKRTLQEDGTTKSELKIAYYPDWHYNPTAKPTALGGKPVMWLSPVYHVKVGGFSDWKFGVPEVYAAIDWARAYKEFLEDVATLMRAYSRFAWRMITKGGKKGIAQAKAKLGSTLGIGGGAETNPPPQVGSIFLGSEGTSMDPYNVRGASINPEDGRRILLMVAAAVGLPETFFGDVSVGTLATAHSLDRPTELAMRDRQTLWADVHRNIFEYVLTWAVKASSGPLSGLGTIEVDTDDGQIVEKLVWNEDVNARIDIGFAPLIEKDIEKSIKAIVTAATLNGSVQAGTIPMPELVRLLLVTLGVDDVDEILEGMFPDGEVPDQDQDEDLDQETEEAFVGAVRTFRDELREFVEKYSNGEKEIA